MLSVSPTLRASLAPNNSSQVSDNSETAVCSVSSGLGGVFASEHYNQGLFDDTDLGKSVKNKKIAYKLTDMRCKCSESCKEDGILGAQILTDLQGLCNLFVQEEAVKFFVNQIEQKNPSEPLIKELKEIKTEIAKLKPSNAMVTLLAPLVTNLNSKSGAIKVLGGALLLICAPVALFQSFKIIHSLLLKKGPPKSIKKTNINSKDTIPPQGNQIYSRAREAKLASLREDFESWASGKVGKMGHIFLYGKAGTGKTMFAKKLMRTKGVKFIWTSGSDIQQFESESLQIQELKRLIDLARQNPRCIIFIDECDLLNKSSLQAIQTEFDNAYGESVVLMFATNEEEKIAEAIKSRCGYIIKYELPLVPALKKLFDRAVKENFQRAGISPPEFRSAKIAKEMEDKKLSQRACVRLVEVLLQKCELKKPCDTDVALVVVDLLAREQAPTTNYWLYIMLIVLGLFALLIVWKRKKIYREIKGKLKRSDS